MTRNLLIRVTAVALIALSGVATAFAASKTTEDANEMAMLLAAKTSLVQAITAAEQKTGGHAMRADAEREKGAYVYEIKVASKDKVTNVFVDTTTGTVTRQSGQSLFAKVFDRDDQEEFAKLAASPMTLSNAVAAAEKDTGGKAVEAAFERENGTGVFEIKVAKDNAGQRVKIDAATGKVLKVSALERE